MRVECRGRDSTKLQAWCAPWRSWQLFTAREECNRNEDRHNVETEQTHGGCGTCIPPTSAPRLDRSTRLGLI